MPTLHVTASGKICKDEATGLLKKHDAARCCADCTNCSGGADNAPIAYKVVFASIVANDPVDCSNANYIQYNKSYVCPNTASCTWQNTADVPNVCSVPNPGTAKVKLVCSSLLNEEIGVTYTIGTDPIAAEEDAVYIEPYGGKPNCLTFNNEDIRFNSVLGAEDYCNFAGSTCKVTSLG